MSKAPLAGIKVVEIAGIGPGPCAGMMLADMGAEVIVIERKSAADAAAAMGTANDMNKHMFFNRGKKSIGIDMKAPEGVEAALKFIEDADILLEGFRPGVMERLGLGPDVCLQRNPKLVYGRMTGWGQYGPLSHAAGHDSNYTGISGAQWYGGRKGSVPTAPLTLVGDLGGGTMMLLWGVMCALNHAGQTGEGQVVDAAITDGSAYLSSLLMMMNNTGQIADEFGTGWADGGAPWSETYECADGGFINVCALEPQFYQQLIELLELTDNPLFSNQWDTASWDKAKVELATLFRRRTRDQWCELLEGTDSCFAPVLNFTEAAEHPHNVERKTFLEIEGVLQPAPAPKLSLNQPEVGVAPIAGGNRDELIAASGWDADFVAELKAKQVI
ncbi:MAG: CaiB/BaiF CoA-transferase family protein [Candidatus Pelagadaptatus aseana]|uniref:CaiB/BaiF CoA transferase family protein n=1 Tax=Candidatus Pelagadaptatus aseana TaxID=3120508 RepID=UPI0039B23E67